LYYVDIEHQGLGKFRRVQGQDRRVVEKKAQAQRQVWDEQWERRLQTERSRKERASKAYLTASKKELAASQTEEAQKEIAELGTLLANALTQQVPDVFSPLYDHSKYSASCPKLPSRPQPIPEPSPQQPDYRPRLGLLGLLLPSARARRQAAAAERFAAAHAEWVDATARRNKVFELDKKEYTADLHAWEQGKLTLEDEQRSANAEVDKFRQRYLSKDKAAVEEYIDLILSQSDYPQCFPKRSIIEFISETGITIIDYELPTVDALPTLKAAKYVHSRD
jgi:restriction system protein